MIAIYNNNKYKYVSNSRNKEIITKSVKKTDSTFCKENDIYYKSVEENDLTDIYAIEFFIFFDTGFEYVPTWWKITEADLMNNNVKIRYASGILPDWDIEEKNICTKLIHYEEITKTKVKYDYRKIDRKEVDLLVKEKNVGVLDFFKIMNEYSEKGI